MSDSKRVYIVAGEASGDAHAALLVRELQNLHPHWEFVGMGGERMQEQGVQLRVNLVERAVMGIRKVLAELGSMVRIASGCLNEFRKHKPDLLILVDYPGLNLNIARIAKRYGIPVVYYICPQVWAWAPWRVRRIAKRVDQLLVILPFEEGIYGEHHNNVHFVGNPVFDHLKEQEEQPLNFDLVQSDEKVLALFPGSRSHEVTESLKAMLNCAKVLKAKDPKLRVFVSCHREKLRSCIEQSINDSSCEAQIYSASSHDLQRVSHLSLVVSGTATLEQAYFCVPQVVVYRLKKWERAFFQVCLQVTPNISLVNLFAGKRLVPEVLFAPGEEDQLIEPALALLDGPKREETIKELQELKAASFIGGGAVRAAEQLSSWVSRESDSTQ